MGKEEQGVASGAVARETALEHLQLSRLLL